MKWESVLAKIDEGVLLVDAKNAIRFVNEAARQLFDLSEEIAGRDLSEIVPEPEVGELSSQLFQSADSPQREISIHRNGASRLLAVTGSRLDDEVALLVFKDITAQRRLEEMGSAFVGNVSHELRTPISILTGYIENLADFPRMPRAEQVEIFGVMQDHATRLKALLDDLVTLAAFDSRSEVLNYADLDLDHFLQRLAKDWRPALASKDMTMRLEVADDARVIRVDRFRFEQVMHNLVDNAFKYTPIEGQIKIRSRRANGHVQISVEDNGAGIPEDDLPHIFERFYRVDKARSRKYGGTGLGLSIVKHIIALHGGTVSAESTMGMSTKIILTLPLPEQAPA